MPFQTKQSHAVPCAELCLILLLASASITHAAPPITAVALAPDRTQVVFGSQAGVEIRRWPELDRPERLATQLAHVHDLRFAPDGRTLLVAGGTPAEEGVVEAWSWPAKQALRQVAGHRDVVYRVAFVPDGRQFATAGGDGVCQIFEMSDGTPLRRFEKHSRAVLGIDYLPDGRTIVSVGADQTLRIWDAAEGMPLRSFDNHVGIINGVATRPSVAAKTLPVVATWSDDRTVRFWQPTIGRLMRFVRLPSPPRTAVWSLDGSRLLVGCDDGQWRAIDPDEAHIVATGEGLPGRIHEILLDPTRNEGLVAGVSGWRTTNWAKLFSQP